ncbi:LysR family transcriptional regulator [Mesobacillus maritimus]|uniref:LysR family transcriptional regulator n=1 Tax=Mesobacillus maritimus TaxID=1643336 RepID=UPI003850CDE8
MEIKDLQIFRSVAYHGSISKAALELNHVQSHVTARIKLLEVEMNTKLFHRHSRGTTLNAEGKKFLSYAERILLTLDDMKKDFQDANNPIGKLSIGTVETVFKLPMILSNYHQNFPMVDLSLTTGVTEELIDKVGKRELDGAFITKAAELPNIEQYEVFNERLVLISNQDDTDIDHLMRKPLLVFKSGCSYRNRLERWLEDEGIFSAKVMEFGTLETILGSVISGLGISFVPKSTIQQLEKNGLIKSHPVPPQYSNISTVFITNSDSYASNSLKKLVETIDQLKNEMAPHDPVNVYSF